MESNLQKFEGVLEYLRDRDADEKFIAFNDRMQPRFRELEPRLKGCKVCRYQCIRDAKIPSPKGLELYEFTRLWADVKISMENGCLGCRIFTLAILHFDKRPLHKNLQIQFKPSVTSLSVLVRPIRGFDGPELNFMFHYPPGMMSEFWLNRRTE